ncbi:response regulator transcription factor [Paenibacillus albicereus]|uniref:Response regulator transcription factor n=1 Tax=Paenibacillus albicereus TaxID=2726185 RepID=A0A6H2H103_9BACL|nr:response regulator transcription factor [Paenibacillus albicereus]QJC53279.1 response regulator transcription factor [Paenibacillus albicereus]
MYRITIVEDDDKIARLLGEALERYGFEPQRAQRMKELTLDFEEQQPHLVLMDINLPYFDGFYWCRQFRQRSNAPVLFISARSGEMDQVMAIENGGDDYVTKPIHLDLLLAKIKSALRRSYGEYAAAPRSGEGAERAHDPQASDKPGHGAPAGSFELRCGALRLDISRSLLLWREQSAQLSRNERLLAEALLEADGAIVSRDRLLESLWDDTAFVDDNTLTVNVTRLRRKLEELGLGGVLETHRGQGYRLNDADLAAGPDGGGL